LVFSLLVSGPGWSVFLTAAGISFFHLTFFWMIPVIVLAVTIARALAERRLDRRGPLAALLGVLAGWLLRPHPLGAARIVYVQIVDLTLAKQARVPLAFGKELLPISWNMLVQNFHALLLLLGIAVVIALLAAARRA